MIDYVFCSIVLTVDDTLTTATIYNNIKCRFLYPVRLCDRLSPMVYIQHTCFNGRLVQVLLGSQIVLSKSFNTRSVPLCV